MRTSPLGDVLTSLQRKDKFLWNHYSFDPVFTSLPTPLSSPPPVASLQQQVSSQQAQLQSLESQLAAGQAALQAAERAGEETRAALVATRQLVSERSEQLRAVQGELRLKESSEGELQGLMKEERAKVAALQVRGRGVGRGREGGRWGKGRKGESGRGWNRE